MSDINSQRRRTKVVYPPAPTDSSLLTSIYSIEIEENEAVEWQWLELPDGNRVVTNYKIISQQETKHDR
ncbi:MAG: hypothetical protein QNJ72_08125 [Pleurocapsa sp. MO_226.B13]|nr:hypothetical protein [Pleurocapsa sp. MO_226.B13]